jgi:hypothetical protein
VLFICKLCRWLIFLLCWKILLFDFILKKASWCPCAPNFHPKNAVHFSYFWSLYGTSHESIQHRPVINHIIRFAHWWPSKCPNLPVCLILSVLARLLKPHSRTGVVVEVQSNSTCPRRICSATEVYRPVHAVHVKLLVQSIYISQSLLSLVEPLRVLQSRALRRCHDKTRPIIALVTKFFLHSYMVLVICSVEANEKIDQNREAKARCVNAECLS